MFPLFRHFGLLALLVIVGVGCNSGDLDFSNFGCDVTGQGGYCHEPYDPDPTQYGGLIIVLDASGRTEAHRQHYYRFIGVGPTGDTVVRFLVSATSDSTHLASESGRLVLTYLGLVDGASLPVAELACETDDPTRAARLAPGATARVVYELTCRGLQSN